MVVGFAKVKYCATETASENVSKNENEGAEGVENENTEKDPVQLLMQSLMRMWVHVQNDTSVQTCQENETESAETESAETESADNEKQLQQQLQQQHWQQHW